MGEVRLHSRAPGRQEKKLAEDSSAAAKGTRAYGLAGEDVNSADFVH